jgi:hypothetical protein
VRSAEKQEIRHVWSYDFVAARTWDGRPIKMWTVIDEYTRESLAIKVSRRLDSRVLASRGRDLKQKSSNYVLGAFRPAYRERLEPVGQLVPSVESQLGRANLPAEIRRPIQFA